MPGKNSRSVLFRIAFHRQPILSKSDSIQRVAEWNLRDPSNTTSERPRQLPSPPVQEGRSKCIGRRHVISPGGSPMTSGCWRRIYGLVYLSRGPFESSRIFLVSEPRQRQRTIWSHREHPGGHLDCRLRRESQGQPSKLQRYTRRPSRSQK